MFLKDKLSVPQVIKMGAGNAISNKTVNATKKRILWRAFILHDSKKHEKDLQSIFYGRF